MSKFRDLRDLGGDQAVQDAIKAMERQRSYTGPPLMTVQNAEGQQRVERAEVLLVQVVMEQNRILSIALNLLVNLAKVQGWLPEEFFEQQLVGEVQDEAAQ